MAYSIDKEIFVKYAVEIAELMNLVHNKSNYDTHHVEISCVLLDYNDGMGYRVVSRAMVRNPTELIYDMVSDVLGPPEDALISLLNQLKKDAGGNYDLKYKSKISKYN